jgi:phosphoglycerate-specific signal transduction histidine kinase
MLDLSPDVIKQLLSSGGNGALLVMVYIAFSVKDKLTKYLDGVNVLLAELQETTRVLKENQDRIQAEVEELKRITTVPLKVSNG